MRAKKVMGSYLFLYCLLRAAIKKKGREIKQDKRQASGPWEAHGVQHIIPRCREKLAQRESRCLCFP